MNATARRTAASVLAWTAGAAASVAVSLVALSSIDAGSATGPSQQLAPDGLTRVEADTASAPASPEAPISPASPPSPAAEPSAAPAGPPASTTDAPEPATTSVQRLLSSPAGTIVASCTGNTVYLRSWSPAQGYEVIRVRRGPAVEAFVTFRSQFRRVTLDVGCVGGRPVLENGYGGR